MNAELYRAAYRWTKEELQRSTLHHYGALIGPNIRRCISISAVLLAALSIFALVANSLNSFATLFALLFIGIAIYWLLLRRSVVRQWVGRRFDKRPDANALLEWEFSEAKITIRCEGLASSELQWKAFIKIVETGDGLLLYPHKNLFYWIPFSAFEPAVGIEKVQQFANVGGVPYLRTTA